jgi:hypothetical protein
LSWPGRQEQVRGSGMESMLLVSTPIAKPEAIQTAPAPPRVGAVLVPPVDPVHASRRPSGADYRFVEIPTSSCAVAFVSGSAAGSGRDDLRRNAIWPRHRAADRRGRRLFSDAFNAFWTRCIIHVRLSCDRGRYATGGRNAGFSINHAARRRRVFQSRCRIVGRNNCASGIQTRVACDGRAIACGAIRSRRAASNSYGRRATADAASRRATSDRCTASACSARAAAGRSCAGSSTARATATPLSKREGFSS